MTVARLRDIPIFPKLPWYLDPSHIAGDNGRARVRRSVGLYVCESSGRRKRPTGLNEFIAN
jgi:hypothetical protein